MALSAYNDLARNDTPEMRASILHTALARGFWSVWLQVFHDDLDMPQTLDHLVPGDRHRLLRRQYATSPTAGWSRMTSYSASPERESFSEF